MEAQEKTAEELADENAELRARLDKAVDTRRAGREGEVEVTDRKGALRHSENFIRSVLDSMPAHVAVLDRDGTILQVNEAWRQFALENGAPKVARAYVGMNYLELCRSALASDAPGAPVASECLEKLSCLMRGESTQFDLEYPCHAPDQERWFLMRAAPVADGDGCVVVSHIDITTHKQAEQALWESREQLTRAQQIAHLGSWKLDLLDNRLTWSDEVYRLFGLQPQEFGATYEAFLDHVHPDDRTAVDNAYTDSLREGHDTYEIEHRVVRKDTGEIRIVHEKCDHFRDASGRIIQSVGMVHDITERKRTEEAMRESEGRFRTMADGLSLIVWVHGADGQLQFVNRTYCEFFGVSEAEMLGGRWQALLHPDDAPVYTGEFRACVRECRPFHAEIRVRRADGQWRWIESWARPRLSASGDYLGFVGASADVSERKQAEANLQVANAQLAEADRRKDEFLAMLAHELRNPLAPVRNAVQILQAVGSKDPTAQRQKDVIGRQVTHMARLLDDLLDVSRVTRGKIALEKQLLPLIDVLAHAIEIATPLVQRRRHELTYAPPADVLVVEGDRDRLAQIFGNLLTNAAKYTNEGGQIWLEAVCENDQAVVRVRDNGTGIAPELLPRVFDLFAQADHSLGRAQGGLGIGLTMVQRLVQMHGGTVAARSAGLGQGSEFIVRLPALAAEAAAEITSPAVPIESDAGAASCRVLIVDDVADSAESLAELVSLWGHETRAVHSGAAALGMARDFLPTVALLDIGMPGMDGYELARRLRAQHGPHLMLVAMTGYGQVQDREATRAAGFNHHLVKPVDLDALGVLLEIPSVD